MPSKRTKKRDTSSEDNTVISDHFPCTDPEVLTENGIDLMQEESSKRRFAQKAVLLVALTIIVGGMWMYAAPRGFGMDDAARTEKQNAEEKARIVAAVSKLFIVPTDDQPVLATVTDAQTLSTEQPFFRNAQNGDKLLVFPKYAQAFLYRPSEDMLVNVGPVQNPGQNPAPTAKDVSYGPADTEEGPTP